MPHKVVVVGSGFAGISAACYLAKDGFDVTVVEKNAKVGGRARSFTKQGFMFDMGPSWYWMPDVFEDFFAAFGKKPSDFYDLHRLDPSYRVYFGKDDYWDIPANFEELCALFEQEEPGSSKELIKFLDEAAYKYEVGIHDLVHKPGLSVTEFASLKLMKDAVRLHVFRSFATYVRKYFKSDRILQLLEFPVLFLGATPENTPALYSLMNYADIKLGTWYPMGGMTKVVEGMVDVAKSLGVKFELDCEIEKFVVIGKEVSAAETSKGLLQADLWVAGADYAHVDQKLLPTAHRQYSDKYWDSRVMAPSSLIFYLGLNKKIEAFEHHNLFFDADFSKHAEEIYEDPVWPEKPLFYVCRPSKTDATISPEGQDNLFVLIPLAPDLVDTDELREEYYHKVMDRMEQLTGENIKDAVVVKEGYAHRDFKKDYHAFKGNAYGLANTLKQTAILKPRIQHKKLTNLYYTGQLTVPGPGVPPSLISGKVVAGLIAKSIKENQPV